MSAIGTPRTSDPVPLLVVDALEQHGVAAYARDLAAEVARSVGRDVSVTVDELAARAGRAPVRPRAHLQFTDRLWGDSPAEAAAFVERLADCTRLTVTLHDLPQPSDGERNLRRRSDAYARVVAAAEGVVVNSRHEALLLREYTAESAEATVIPLPVSVHPGPASRPVGDGTVAVLGFFYPGKGHAEVVEAVAALAAARQGGGIDVTVLGRASPGHEGELAELAVSAEDLGVRVEVTGWLADDALLDRCRRASVPVAAHRHVSASASVTAWIAAGRRPLVPDSRASRELAELRPGTLTLVRDGELTAAIGRAFDEPESTWLGGDAVTGPDLADTARDHLRWWAEVTR